VEIDRHRRSIFTAHAVPVDAAQGGGAVLVLRDITELRRIDQVRRDFVTNVSHELRTPLTAIRGYLEALREVPPPPRALAGKFLDIIERHAGRMERLVKDLLRLARLDARQDTLEMSPVTTTALVQGVTNDLEASLMAKQQSVETAVGAGADVFAADPVRLADALRNLVENASNYGPVGVPIDVTATRDCGHVHIAVADRGPGIPEADLGRIFERFYRVDRSRSVDPGGTGLGLSIARHLVELHGGRISAANRADGGAIVTISLPA
jgi:two-component system phosphate regulon sensor histidine kinase PhoR